MQAETGFPVTSRYSGQVAMRVAGADRGMVEQAIAVGFSFVLKPAPATPGFSDAAILVIQPVIIYTKETFALGHLSSGREGSWTNG